MKLAKSKFKPWRLKQKKKMQMDIITACMDYKLVKIKIVWFWN